MNETPMEALGMVLGLSSLTLIPFFLFLGVIALLDRRTNK